MRVVVSAWNLRQVGGIESYLATVIPELVEAGCKIAMLGEVDGLTLHPRIAPSDVVTWCVADLGLQTAIEACLQWAPDIIFVNGAPALETQRLALKIAPAVFYAHGYHGTCISGAKSFKFPQVRPCHRRFGAMCLAHYLPHRCGGLSPITMLRLYRQTKDQALLMRRYEAILAVSEAVRQEYVQHQFVESSRVITLQYPFRPPSALPVATSAQQDNPALLLFVGRMTEIKGGHLLIDATAEVARTLGRTVKLILAGDGPQRANLERQARRVVTANNGVQIEFTGWLRKPALEALFARADLLVVPSLWPEPSALVGREAGLYGVPQVAFAVGGNREWLTDGVNGYLASGEPPTRAGLAEAIVKCLRDCDEHARLRRGAREIASRFTAERHIDALTELFKMVIERSLRC